MNFLDNFTSSKARIKFNRTLQQQKKSLRIGKFVKFDV